MCWLVLLFSLIEDLMKSGSWRMQIMVGGRLDGKLREVVRIRHEILLALLRARKQPRINITLLMQSLK